MIALRVPDFAMPRLRCMPRTQPLHTATLLRSAQFNSSAAIKTASTVPSQTNNSTELRKYLRLLELGVVLPMTIAHARASAECCHEPPFNRTEADK